MNRIVNYQTCRGDVMGEAQFGGSEDDAGSSTTDESEAHWGPAKWQRMLPYQRYGTQVRAHTVNLAVNFGHAVKLQCEKI
jgi:hypothetical protein